MLAAVRVEIGPDVPLAIRVSGSELVPGGLDVVEFGQEMTLATQGLHAGHNLVIQNLTLFHRHAALLGVSFLTAARPLRFDGSRITLLDVFSRQALDPLEFDSFVLADPYLTYPAP